MDRDFTKKLLQTGIFAFALWLGIRYLLPVALPFGLGGLLAISAEPAVAFGVRRLKLPRPLAAGAGVALTVIFCAVLLWLAGAVAVRELGQLAKALPDLQAGAATVESWLSNAAKRAPRSLQAPATAMVDAVFDTAFLQKLSGHLPGLLKNLAGRVGSSLLGIGTGLISAFLISARLPQLRQKLAALLPEGWHTTWKPALFRVRDSLWGWVRAQLRLSAVTWAIVTAGFWLLGIPWPFLWAIPVAFIDAIPILGTGTVLMPWALVCLLQEQPLRAAGLGAIYAAAAVTRTVLEPRLVGKQLGLDPLATLAALYAGYRLWGIGGLLLTPILASAVRSLFIRNNS